MRKTTNAMARAYTFTFCIFTFVASSIAVNFSQCHIAVQNALDNAFISNASDVSPLYQGPLRGFRLTEDQRPLTLTQQGCKDWCGSGSQINGIIEAFQIVTTWVLPSLALFNQLPFESLSNKKKNNLKALFNWVGSPAATLSTTLWNIRMIQKCRVLSDTFTDVRLDSESTDSLYILSCINQYEYPRRSARDSRYQTNGTTDWARADRRRDVALLRGVLFPYVGSTGLSNDLREQLVNLNQHLAFQLRLQRRRGVWPLAFNLVWFLLAFIFSIVVAFDESLGDNSTAHSLALGLLLTWLPVVVVATIVDRNPISATRCKVLIERWLYNIDGLFAMDLRSPQPRLPRHEWARGEQTDTFSVGGFVGQGRRMRYCAVTDTVLDMIGNKTSTEMPLPGPDQATILQTNLPKRSPAWYGVWVLSGLIVTLAFGMAFLVSYKTPTVGLGCRSLAYMVWYLTSSISWVLLFFCQEPHRVVRYISQVANALAAVFLWAIMLLQVLNGMNNCFCKSSAFETGLSNGYMDFESGPFYQVAYDVVLTWGVATGFGLAGCFSVLFWLFRRYDGDKKLWRVKEQAEMRVLEGVSLEWLT